MFGKKKNIHNLYNFGEDSLNSEDENIKKAEKLLLFNYGLKSYILTENDINENNGNLKQLLNDLGNKNGQEIKIFCKTYAHDEKKEEINIDNNLIKITPIAKVFNKKFLDLFNKTIDAISQQAKISKINFCCDNKKKDQHTFKMVKSFLDYSNSKENDNIKNIKIAFDIIAPDTKQKYNYLMNKLNPIINENNERIEKIILIDNGKKSFADNLKNKFNINNIYIWYNTNKFYNSISVLNTNLELKEKMKDNLIISSFVNIDKNYIKKIEEEKNKEENKKIDEDIKDFTIIEKDDLNNDLNNFKESINTGVNLDDSSDLSGITEEEKENNNILNLNTLNNNQEVPLQQVIQPPVIGVEAGENKAPNVADIINNINNINITKTKKKKPKKAVFSLENDVQMVQNIPVGVQPPQAGIGAGVVEQANKFNFNLNNQEQDDSYKPEHEQNNNSPPVQPPEDQNSYKEINIVLPKINKQEITDQQKVVFDRKNTSEPNFNLKLKNNKDTNLNIKDYQQQISLPNSNTNNTNNTNTNEQPKLSIPDDNKQQGTKKPEFNLALAMLLLITIIGFILYILDYLSKHKKWKEINNRSNYVENKKRLV